MKTTKEIIDQINSMKLSSPHFAKDELNIPDIVEVATVDHDEHRWFVVGTIVFKIGEDYIGVRGPVSLKSESMGYDDVGYECEAFEIERVTSVTFKRKTKNHTTAVS